jgi:hypothetical protein
MNEKDVKKLVELQGRILKLKDRIEQDVRKHNKMVVEELRPMTDDILHNTIYQVGDMTYKRGRVFSQLEVQDYGLGAKAEGLATLRKVETEDVPDAPTHDTTGGPSAPLSK